MSPRAARAKQLGDAVADVRAVQTFKMISGAEETVRKVVGLLIVCITLRSYFRYGGLDLMPLYAWHLLFAAGVVVYRMGVESQ